MKPTLWLDEVSLLNTGLQSLVEEVVKHVIGDGDVVVGLDVLLEGWSAGQMLVESRSCARRVGKIEIRKQRDMGKVLTWTRISP